jgi:hypothetical protein
MAFDVHADVREEVTNFWKGKKPYRIHDGQATTREAVQLFLERNFVARLPEEGALEVSRSDGWMMVDGNPFGTSDNVFEWQETASLFARQIEREAALLREAIVNHEKARAVLAFLAQEQEAEKAREMARETRLTELSQEFFDRDYSALTGPKAKRVLERIVELEEQVTAAS